MSSNHNTSGKHNLGLKRIIENSSFTTYPTVLRHRLICSVFRPTMPLTTPLRLASPVFSSLQRMRYTSINEHQHNADSILFNCHLS